MANGESVADPLRTVCQAHWTAPATLAHHPARPGRDEQRSLVKLAQVVRDTACSLLEALAGIRSLCSVLQSRKRSHAFRLPNEQAQEASQLRPASPAGLDELGPGPLSWCEWRKKCWDP